MHDRALVAVSFGSTHLDAIESSIAPCEAALAAAFPDRRCLRAFTSSIVRRRLRESRGLGVPSPAEAFEALARKGCRDILVQPLLIVPGEEYVGKILEPLEAGVSGIELVHVGGSLLPAAGLRLASLLEDFRRLTDPGADLVLMGHGTSHGADACYRELQARLDEAGHPIHIGTVEGSLGLASVLARLEPGGSGSSRGPGRTTRRLILAPLMLVAGEHARVDMAGPEPESWLSRLRAERYATDAVLEGLGSAPAIQGLFVEAAQRAVGAAGAAGGRPGDPAGPEPRGWSARRQATAWPIEEGSWATRTPAARSAPFLPEAAPLAVPAIAPAWPILRPGGAEAPATKAATGLVIDEAM